MILASSVAIFRVAHYNPRTMDAQTLRQAVTDAITYWEPRRILYNAMLAIILLAYFAIYYPASRSALTVEYALLVFVLAVLANVAYCAAYVPDIFAQASGYQSLWRRCRWLVFAVGLLFAAAITRFFALALFHPPTRIP